MTILREPAERPGSSLNGLWAVFRRMAGDWAPTRSPSFVGHGGRSPSLLLLAEFWMAGDATST